MLKCIHLSKRCDGILNGRVFSIFLTNSILYFILHISGDQGREKGDLVIFLNIPL